MIAAWFMRFGRLTLQGFSDVGDLADTIVMLDDADTSVYDQWGSFDHAFDTITGEKIPRRDIEAAKRRVEAENAEEAAAYVPPKCSHHIYMKDIKGDWHHFRSIRADDQTSVQLYTERLAGLLLDGRAEIREVAA